MKTHFRKVYKSNHLGSADIEEFIEEGKDLIFTIKEVKQEYKTEVAGKKIDANIAYFVENIKPLVLNATNAKIVRSFANSAFVEDWTNIRIELYIDESVKMKGQKVGGVRIKLQQPEKAPLKRLSDVAFQKFIAAMVAGTYTEAQARELYVFTKDQEAKIQEVNKSK